MAWDFRIDQTTGDLTSGYATGQDEIIQRVITRVTRLLGEWWVNTSVGVPWYEGPSDLIAGQLTQDNAILGSKDLDRVDLLLRNEISETEGVIRIVEFKPSFDGTTRQYNLFVSIATEYGTADLNVNQPMR